MIEEKGPWAVVFGNGNTYIESDDFTHDAHLYVRGDFESAEHRAEYAEEIARRLNTFAAKDAEIARIKADKEGLVCGDCDGSGWLENREDGRYPCACMTEAEPYQILQEQLAEAQAEINEQARIVGMGGEREIALRKKLDIVSALLREAAGRMSYGHWSSEFRGRVEKSLKTKEPKP